jgi:2-C-methyl-D-erythritol 4-phosphate cytidylyltransferase
MKSKVAVIIVAGGSGRRIGGKVRKQFIKIGGHPILCWTLWQFHQLEWVDQIVLVVPEDTKNQVKREIIKKYHFHLVKCIVNGGNERQKSVLNGLTAIEPNTKFVLIHDAVRPFISQNSLTKLYKLLKNTGSAVIGFPSRDTVKEVKNLKIIETKERKKIWLVQTPQAFNFDLILEAHYRAQKDRYQATDDSNLIERMNIPVCLVEGDYFNIKITTPFDLEIAEKILPHFFSKNTFSYVKL